MKKPPPGTYIIGNALTCTVLLGATLMTVWGWSEGKVPAFWPLGTVVALIAAGNANDQIRKYRHWKRAWDAMAGMPVKRPRGPDILGGLVLLAWIGIAAYLATLDLRPPQNKLAIGGFGLLTVLWFAASAYRHFRPARPARKRPPKDVPVTLSLPVPKSSPGGAQLYADLPEYCQRLN